MKLIDLLYLPLSPTYPNRMMFAYGDEVYWTRRYMHNRLTTLKLMRMAYAKP